MSYVIVGAGAIGGTLGHHLARAGHEVTVVDADPEHVRAIRRHGIVVRRGDERTAVPVAAALTPDEPGPRQVGRVLLAVKAHATGRALDWIAPRLTPDGFVVSLQNGLNEQAIADRVGAERTVGAFVNLFADVVGRSATAGSARWSSASWTDATRRGCARSSPTCRPGGRRGPPGTSPATCGPSSGSARCSWPPRSPTRRWPT
jgi:ketopantoate reductase